MCFLKQLTDSKFLIIGMNLLIATTREIGDKKFLERIFLVGNKKRFGKHGTGQSHEEIIYDRIKVS